MNFIQFKYFVYFYKIIEGINTILIIDLYLITKIYYLLFLLDRGCFCDFINILFVFLGFLFIFLELILFEGNICKYLFLDMSFEIWARPTGLARPNQT